MSFERGLCGFDPKNKDHMSFLHKRGIVPILHSLKTKLPPGNKEPEPKLLLQRSKDFSVIRAFISFAQNAFIFPDQILETKDSLVSILLDSTINGFPAAHLVRNNYSLRFRFEICSEDRKDEETGKFVKRGEVTNRDFNEKSAMAGAPIIGGCANRDEREMELRPGESLRAGFARFIEYHDTIGDPAYCRTIPYDNLSVAGGYLAARNTYNFAVIHPEYPVLFVFEACEDVFETLESNLAGSTTRLKEFEFEAKQVWGQLPHFARSPIGFRHFLYSTMTMVRDSIHMAVPGSQINMKSKAEITKEHLVSVSGLDENVECRRYFKSLYEKETGLPFIPEQYVMIGGPTLETAMTQSIKHLRHRALKLHFNKSASNKGLFRPEPSMIIAGTHILNANDDGARSFPLAVPT